MHIIGLLGAAGAGKSTIAEIIAPVHLVELNGALVDMRGLLRSRSPATRVPTNPPERALRPRAFETAFTDELKVFCHRVYDFSFEQLWGPSTERDAPDKRWLRARPHQIVAVENENHVCARCKLNTLDEKTPTDCHDYLSPREALQLLGTEGARGLHPDTWVRCGLRSIQRLSALRIAKPVDAHTFAPNWIIEQNDLAVVSNVRYANEVDAIHEAGGEVWRVVRPGAGLSGVAGLHASETEQTTLAVDVTINNDNGTMEALRATVAQTLKDSGR